MVTSLIANDPRHNQSVDVSYFAQTPDGQRRNRNSNRYAIAKAFGLHFQLAEPEPIKVFVVSLRNMSGERKYHANAFKSARGIAEASAARRSRWCRCNDCCWLLLGWLVARQHRRQHGKTALGARGRSGAAPVCADKFRALPDHLFEEAERCFRRSRTNLKMRFELEARGNMFMVKAVELDIKLRKIANDNYTVSTRGDDDNRRRVAACRRPARLP